MSSIPPNAFQFLGGSRRFLNFRTFPIRGETELVYLPSPLHPFFDLVWFLPKYGPRHLPVAWWRDGVSMRYVKLEKHRRKLRAEFYFSLCTKACLLFSFCNFLLRERMLLKSRNGSSSSSNNEEENALGRADASCSEMCIAPDSVGIVVGISATGESQSH